MADESEHLAFRRLVVSVSDKISDEEVRKIVYIHLYTQRETLFRDANKLEILGALEYAEIFNPANPEGLLNIVEKDLKNRHLTHLVKDFIREKKHRAVKLSDSAMSGGMSPGEKQTDTHLRMCYHVALAQANVFMKHLEALRQAVAEPVESERAQEAVKNISETAVALTKLRDKIRDVHVSRPSISGIKSDGITASETDSQDDYEDIVSEAPVFEEVKFNLAPAAAKKKSKPPRPPLKPKPQLKPKVNTQQQKITPAKDRRYAALVQSASKTTSFPCLESLSDASEKGNADNSYQPLLQSHEDVTGNEDDYIDTMDFQINRNDGTDLQRGSQILPKSSSLTHLLDAPNRDSTVVLLTEPNHPPPLPEPPVDGKGDGEEGSTSDEDQYVDPAEFEEDDEPMYEKINPHTLFSRVRPIASADSGSSSD